MNQLTKSNPLIKRLSDLIFNVRITTLLIDSNAKIFPNQSENASFHRYTYQDKTCKPYYFLLQKNLFHKLKMFFIHVMAWNFTNIYLNEISHIKSRMSSLQLQFEMNYESICDENEKSNFDITSSENEQKVVELADEILNEMYRKLYESNQQFDNMINEKFKSQSKRRKHLFRLYRNSLQMVKRDSVFTIKDKKFANLRVL